MTTIQTYCDIFIGKKDNNNYENSENKMAIIKELNNVKVCKCPEILIIDDNAFNIYSSRKQLESFSFKIETANDGEEAFNMVFDYFHSSNRCCKGYLLIFMDLEMPIKDGYESSLEIRNLYEKYESNLETRIIACSAHPIEEKHEKHKLYGMDEFITKPIIKERLIFLLGKYLKLDLSVSPFKR